VAGGGVLLCCTRAYCPRAAAPPHAVDRPPAATAAPSHPTPPHPSPGALYPPCNREDSVSSECECESAPVRVNEIDYR
jgi:hypothetical protein